MPRLEQGYARFMHGVYTPDAGVRPAVLKAGMHQRARVDGRARFAFTPSDWLINYSPDNGMAVTLDDGATWIDRPARQLQVIRPGTGVWQSLAAADGRSFRGRFLIVRDDVALAPLQGDRPLLCIDDPQGRIEQLFVAAFAAGTPDFWSAQALLAQVMALVASVRCDAHGGGSLDVSERTPSLRQHVDAIFHADLRAPHRLEGLARRFEMSPSSLSHRYRRETGATPMRRLAQLRVELVQSLLLAGIPLAEAATLAGFCDQFHCSRVFTSVTGLRPSAFLGAQPA